MENILINLKFKLYYLIIIALLFCICTTWYSINLKDCHHDKKAEKHRIIESQFEEWNESYNVILATIYYQDNTDLKRYVAYEDQIDFDIDSRISLGNIWGSRNASNNGYEYLICLKYNLMKQYPVINKIK